MGRLWHTFKYKLMFGLLYTSFIFSEMVAEDGSALSRLSNKFDSLKIKYILAIFFIGILLIKFIRRSYSCNKFRNETANILIAVGVLTSITVLKQVFNGFRFFAVEEILFLLIPILFVFLLLNNTSVKVSEFINIAFAVQLVFFVINIWNKLTLKNIASINFIESNSPFESEFSFYGLVFFLFYLQKGDKKRCILSFIMTFLAFKRMAVVACLLFLIVNFLYGKRAFIGRPKSKYVNIATVSFIVIALMFHLICNDAFSNWFYELTSIDFNDFISGRLERINLCIDHPMLYGLGSTTEFLNKALVGELNRNLHSDVLRIYLECGILGTLAFTVCFFNITRKNKTSFYLMTYLFTDMLFNHFMGAGRAAFWIVIYMTIFYYNTYNNSDRLLERPMFWRNEIYDNEF